MQPSSSSRGWIEWKNVQLSNTNEPLTKAGAASHYYAARETDAWHLRSEGQTDKLLFYRGIADFGVDLKTSGS